MLTENLFELFTAVGAEWVMWILVVLSIASFAMIIERLAYYRQHSDPTILELVPLLSKGKLEEARGALADRRGMEAEVLREALDAAHGGADMVEDTVAGAIAARRQGYERFLSFLGTLGSNAPFIGLFGTVIGIIDAFASLAVGGQSGADTASVVMGGISEALVATAVGIFVAIPAVVAFNLYSRWLRAITSRTSAVCVAVVAYLRKAE